MLVNLHLFQYSLGRILTVHLQQLESYFPISKELLVSQIMKQEEKMAQRAAYHRPERASTKIKRLEADVEMLSSIESVREGPADGNYFFK